MILNTVIIGSGISGIFTIKHLIEEGITDVLVLDKNPEPFGVWNINNHPSVFENTYTVSSKLYMTISDFPMPNDMPEFPHHSKILEYYKKYAERFSLYKYIINNCKVKNIRKRDNIWEIETNSATYYSRYVVIASGTVNDCPNIPDDDVYKKFTGEMYHSNSFDKIKNVSGKRILIIGGSDTAVDFAMHLKNNNNITISIKNGVWFQNRNAGTYEPSDMFYSRLLDSIIKNVITKKRFHFDSMERFWGTGGSGIDIWKPKCGYLNSYYVKSREIIEQIAKGTIIPENGVIHIQNKKVSFETGHMNEYDIILFCTGYNPTECMDFLDDNIVKSKKYKHIFYVDDPTIMFIGFIRPYLTSIPMIAELQSRWITQIVSGKGVLPSKEIMKKENEKDMLKQKEEFPCAYERLKTMVDPYDYCNLVAANIGGQPSKIKMLFENPSLLYKIIFGTWNHHVFRLNDKDDEKRKIAIENIEEIYETKISKKVEITLWEHISYMIIFIICIAGVLYFIISYVLHTKQAFGIIKKIKKILYKIKRVY